MTSSTATFDAEPTPSGFFPRAETAEGQRTFRARLYPTHAAAKAAAPAALMAWQAEGYATELTPAGEQAVIPGCERNATPGPRQLDLFG